MISAEIKNWLESFERRSKTSLWELDNFHKVLNSLQNVERNTLGVYKKEIERNLLSIQRNFLEHVKLDEQIVFPFMIKHIPKLEPMLRFLSSDHNEAKSRMKKVQLILRNLSYSPQQWQLLKNEGSYVYFLIQNHYLVENSTVYQEIKNELTEPEQSILFRKYRKAINPRNL